MEHKETKLEVVEFVSDIICDCCGKSCKTFHGQFEFLRLSSNWGFYSNKDLETWEAHICEACVDGKLNFIKFTKRSSISGKN